MKANAAVIDHTQRDPWEVATEQFDTAADKLTGGASRDWFFRKLGQDTVTDLNTVAPETGKETVTAIP